MHTYIKAEDTILAIRDITAVRARKLPDFKRLGWEVIKSTPRLRRQRELSVGVYTYRATEDENLLRL